MKKYIKPETQELICKNDLCGEIITCSGGRTTSNNWSREEEDMLWDEEQGW